jgi:glutamyl-tRNA synthetase
MITPNEPVSFYDYFSRTTKQIDLYHHMRHPIIKRKDGIAAYQLASVVDDMEMGITTVVRGVDLLESTATQLLLAQQLHYASFQHIHFYHHPLIMDEHGNKLSKSQGSFCLREYREQHTKQELYASFARWLNFTFEGNTLTDLQRCFNAARLF